MALHDTRVDTSAARPVPQAPRHGRGGDDLTSDQDPRSDEVPQWCDVVAERALPVVKVPTRPRVVLRLIISTLVVAAVVGTLAFFVASRLAEGQVLSDASRMTASLTETELVPSLPGLVSGDEQTRGDLDHVLDMVMRRDAILRIKLFDSSGTVIYSDEPRLIGQSFTFDTEEREALDSNEPIAVLSAPEGLENAYERVPGQLVEVRQAIRHDGKVYLAEVYLEYNHIQRRAEETWGAFVWLLLGSMVLHMALIVPLTWQLLRGLDAAAVQREELLMRSVEASAAERRRIAGSLHDGPVQDLVAATLNLSAGARRLERDGHPDAADSVRDAASTTRHAVAALRSLLVELYPPEGDLDTLLGALLEPLAAQGIETHLDLPPDTDAISTADGLLMARITQESVRNVARHAHAHVVRVSVTQTGAGWQLTVFDNGAGFDPAEALANPAPGHFGLTLLADHAREAGAGLSIRSAPGEGTTIRLYREGTCPPYAS